MESEAREEIWMRASSSAVYVVCKAAFLIGNRLSAIGAMLLLLAIPAFADYYYLLLPPLEEEII